MIYVMNMRTANKGGRVNHRAEITAPQYSEEHDVQELKTGTESQLRSARNVLFLIHGFNNHGNAGETKLLRWAMNLKLSDDWHIVAVLWPGDAKYFGPACYPFQGADADDSGEVLAHRIEDLFGDASSVRICMATHSLGARVALKAISELYDRSWPRVENICLMAAAVDDTCLGDALQYRQAVQHHVSDVGVLYSYWDKVLGAAFPMGELLQNFLYFWRGETFALRALGSCGPQNYPAEQIVTPGTVTKPNNASNLPGNYRYDHSDYIGYEANEFLCGKHRANVEKWLKDRLGVS